MSVRTIDIAGLYASEHGRLRRLVNRFVRNRTTADDLVQQVFVKLLTVADGGRLDNCPAYLTRAAQHLALNYVRDQRRRGEVALPDTELHAIPDDVASPEDIMAHRTELYRVLTAVAALPPRRREAFVLNKFEGMSYDEIAARQGVSRNTVISHIVLALADIDRFIGPR